MQGGAVVERVTVQGAVEDAATGGVDGVELPVGSIRFEHPVHGRARRR
jgi:hypothetical protein